MAVETLLGLPLSVALEKLREAGVEPEVVHTAAPRGNRENATLRVIRVRGNELTVGAFEDGTPV
ncbi:MAG: hypothetical protein E7333_04690 [Clostridiales bacterium]|nr:hypothetical protein [Clostridiales bacterium]